MEVEQFPCCQTNKAIVHDSSSETEKYRKFGKMETGTEQLNGTEINGVEKMEEEEEQLDCRTLPKPETLKDLIEGLHVIFSKNKVNVDMVKAYMSMYKSNPKEWKKFAKWDEHRYTRNLVDAGNGKFNLMVLCWNEAQGSSIHSHANAHCFLKVLDGTVQEVMYDWPAEGQESLMEARESSKFGKNLVTYISDEIGLHRVENPSHTDKAVTLHLYSPPFDECDSFDEKTGHSNRCKVTFWSKFGHRTPFGRCPAKETPENN